jgi:cellulose 1,4-beta-cellobiosidase
MMSRRALGSFTALALFWALAVGCASASGARTAVSPVEPATTPPAPAGMNPFAGARLFVNPDYVRALGSLEGRHPKEARLLKKMARFPTAIWLSGISDTRDLARHLDEAAREQKEGGVPVVSVLVLYDLPGRDCNAEASAGELPADEGGEARYQHDYIDVIAAALRSHPDGRIAIVVEPDSLSNLVTNLPNPRCAAVEGIYKRGVAYAISKLSLPNVFLYIEASHAGWLSWPKNIVRSVPLYAEVLRMAGGADRIRGFALNVSNYDPLEAHNPTPRDPAGPSDDELGYVNDLAQALGRAGITGKGFVVDTGRNGRADIRTAAGSWCNVRGAGLGQRPRAAPAPLVDAYLYIKVPGESDGTSDPRAPRFDPNCASDDAAAGAPQAGAIFDDYLIDLLENANPPL